MVNAFIPFIKAVGRGEKLKRDLTYEEAKEAMTLMLSGQATEAQIGAFLISQRVKGESVAEILGFVDAARACSSLIEPQVEGLMDLALPYDGKVKSLQLGPVIALTLAAAGQPVVMHGDRDIPTKSGVGPVELLTGLGVTVDLPPETVKMQLEELGIGFLYAPQFAPQWHALTPIRHQFGLRTALNTAEKFLNPANAPLAVSGFFHRNYILRLLEMGAAIAPQTWIVQGIEGSIECLPGRANPIYQTNLEQEAMIVKGEGLGFGKLDHDIEASADPAYHIAMTESILKNKPSYALDTVLLTAGILLFIGQKVDSIQTGVTVASETIAAGKARQLLEEWQLMG